MRELKAALIAVVAITLVFGLAYPLAMTGVGQVVAGGRADGSLVERDGKVVGSKLIGQDFSKNLSSFQSRPSATEYSASATFFNNQARTRRSWREQLRKNLRAYMRREGVRASQVPSDAVTTSASGVDPHISEANARIQSRRVAERRGLSRARVLKLVDANTSKPLFGLESGSAEDLHLPGTAGPGRRGHPPRSLRRLDQTHQAIEAWIRAENLSVAGPPWETYLTDPGDHPDPETWETEIVHPVR